MTAFCCAVIGCHVPLRNNSNEEAEVLAPPVSTPAPCDVFEGRCTEDTSTLSLLVLLVLSKKRVLPTTWVLLRITTPPRPL